MGTELPGQQVALERLQGTRELHFKMLMVIYLIKFLPDTSFVHLEQWCSTKSELRLCAGSNPARGVSEIRDGEDL